MQNLVWQKKSLNDCATAVSLDVHEPEHLNTPPRQCTIYQVPSKHLNTPPRTLILESVRRHKRLGINVIPRNATNTSTFNTFIAPKKVSRQL